jgi:hypothetical protein
MPDWMLCMASQRCSALRVVRRIGRVLHRELAHRLDVAVEEDQGRQGLVDGHAQDLAEAGEARGRNAVEEAGLAQLAGIAHAAQHAVVEQHAQRLGLAGHEAGPVALGALDEGRGAQQVQPVAELQVAEEGDVVGPMLATERMKNSSSTFTAKVMFCRRAPSSEGWQRKCSHSTSITGRGRLCASSTECTVRETGSAWATSQLWLWARSSGT